MRRYLRKCIVIVMVMSLLLCACSSNSTESNNQSNSDTQEGSLNETVNSSETPDDAAVQGNYWTISGATDDFGDPVEDGENYLLSSTIGEFNNTATTGDTLTVKTQFGYIGVVPVFLFTLLEYGNTPAFFTSSDNLSMKIKVGDIITDIGVTIFSDQSVVATDPMNQQGFIIFDNLRKGEDVRAIISTDTSKYSFTLENENFVEAYNRAFPDKEVPDSAEVEDTVSFEEAQKGDIINLGKLNGEDIPWIVLDVQGSKLLVLSEYVLFNKPYYSAFTKDTNWGNSLLNSWLNNEFIEDSFSDSEQSIIIETEHSYCFNTTFSDNESYTATSNQKIFLLNTEEVEKYIPEQNDRIAYRFDDKSTEYWILSDSYPVDKSPHQYLVLSYVSMDGVVERLGCTTNKYPDPPIRPAMWLDYSLN